MEMSIDDSNGYLQIISYVKYIELVETIVIYKQIYIVTIYIYLYKFIYNGYDKNNSNTYEYDCCIYNAYGIYD